MALITGGPAGLDMTGFDIGLLMQGDGVQKTSTLYSILLPDNTTITFHGTGFTYNSDGDPTGGTITGFGSVYQGQTEFEVSKISVPVSTFLGWAQAGNTSGALASIFGGDDTLMAGDKGDTLTGLGGNDTIVGGAMGDHLDGGVGNNSISGGLGGDWIGVTSGANSLDGDAGNDTIIGGSGQDVIRGLDDNDSISGGGDFDYINGNKGQDTIHGNTGADSLLGGQGNDLVYGDEGDDVMVNGNIGDDTVHGGIGADEVHGGQGNDLVLGEDGNDFVSGDLGDDTLTGGAGADAFRLGFNGGVDRVTDFKASEGDHVVVDHGGTYTVSQSGADTVVTLSSGEQLILQGVTASTLPTGWIGVA
jgi:Ca2+-binding RTX toxin-like protein